MHNASETRRFMSVGSTEQPSGAPSNTKTWTTVLPASVIHLSGKLPPGLPRGQPRTNCIHRRSKWSRHQPPEL